MKRLILAIAIFAIGCDSGSKNKKQTLVDDSGLPQNQDAGVDTNPNPDSGVDAGTKPDAGPDVDDPDLDAGVVIVPPAPDSGFPEPPEGAVEVCGDFPTPDNISYYEEFAAAACFGVGFTDYVCDRAGGGFDDIYCVDSEGYWFHVYFETNKDGLLVGTLWGGDSDEASDIENWQEYARIFKVGDGMFTYYDSETGNVIGTCRVSETTLTQCYYE